MNGLDGKKRRKFFFLLFFFIINTGLDRLSRVPCESAESTQTRPEPSPSSSPSFLSLLPNEEIYWCRLKERKAFGGFQSQPNWKRLLSFPFYEFWCFLHQAKSSSYLSGFLLWNKQFKGGFSFYFFPRSLGCRRA